MRWRIPLVISLSLVVAVSCDQQPAAPDTEQAPAAAPTFDFGNNPGWFADGRIYRHPHGGFGWWGVDGESGLLVHLSTASGHYCGYGVDTDPVSAQHIFNEFSHQFELGMVSAELFDWTGFWDTADCSLFPTYYMGSGMVRMVTTDNDVTAYEGDRTRNNAWGIKATGSIDLVGGGTTQLNYTFRMSWNADSGFENIVETVKLGNDPR
jgi:hypothetical protein